MVNGIANYLFIHFNLSFSRLNTRIASIMNGEACTASLLVLVGS